jgi:hypothetical protein
MTTATAAAAKATATAAVAAARAAAGYYHPKITMYSGIPTPRGIVMSEIII